MTEADRGCIQTRSRPEWIGVPLAKADVMAWEDLRDHHPRSLGQD